MQQASYSPLTGKSSRLPANLESVVNQCYQCAKCSAGCPMASEMDILPHQMVRLAVLGDVQPIISSKSLWLCLTCHTCGARCPNGIDVPALLDPIRHQVVRDKVSTQEPQIPAFHEIFLKTIKWFGRVHELSLIGLYKWKTKTLFDDMELGMQMFKKGKIHVLPHRSSHVSEVKDVFKSSSMK